MRLMADCLDIELDSGPEGVTFECQLGAATKDVDLGWYRLPAGSDTWEPVTLPLKASSVTRIEYRIESACVA